MPVALDPPQGGVEGAFLLDLPTGTLSYRIALSSVQPADALGVALLWLSEADWGRGGGAPSGGAGGDGRLELVAYASAGFEHRSLLTER